MCRKEARACPFEGVSIQAIHVLELCGKVHFFNRSKFSAHGDGPIYLIWPATLRILHRFMGGNLDPRCCRTRMGKLPNIAPKPNLSREGPNSRKAFNRLAASHIIACYQQGRHAIGPCDGGAHRDLSGFGAVDPKSIETAYQRMIHQSLFCTGHSVIADEGTSAET